VCVCVCVCERERERMNEFAAHVLKYCMAGVAVRRQWPMLCDYNTHTHQNWSFGCEEILGF